MRDQFSGRVKLTPLIMPAMPVSYGPRSTDTSLPRLGASMTVPQGMVMIHVHADRIHYWDSNDEGEISI